MYFSPYITLNFTSAVVMTLLGYMLLGIHIRRDGKMAKLRVARLILALSYFVLAVPSYMEYFCDTETDTRVIAALTLSTAAFQSLLFTATLLAFILPHFVTRRRVLRQVGAVTIAVAVFLPVALFSPNPSPILYIGLAAYGCQLVYYTIVFRRKYAESLHRLETYYDEDERARLRWVKNGFYAALLVGIVAAISVYLPLLLYNVFTVAYIIFYTWFVIRFNNYVTDAGFYLSAVEEPQVEEVQAAEVQTEEPEVTAVASSSSSSSAAAAEAEAEEEEEEEVEETLNPILQSKELHLRQALDKWVAAKGYVKNDIGTAEVATELGTDLVTLRRYFNTYLPPDFRAWRMELRIREAQRIMKEEPGLPVSQVRERVGINDRSNFRSQFTKITGITPTRYKEQQKTDKDAYPLT